MAEQNLFCLCGRCSRKLRSAAARRVGMGSTCCRKETGKTITQLLKELDEQEAAAAAEQQEPDTQACALPEDLEKEVGDILSAAQAQITAIINKLSA